jgi:hypothetical protein
MEENFYTKLIKCQHEIPVINKSATGQVGHRTYKYAELPEILKIVMPILHKHGLTIIFQMEAQSDGNILKCVLTDSSDGKCAVASIFIPNQPDPQSTGIHITYYRRYLLANILNLSIDDDVDGDLGSGGNSFTQNKEKKPAKEYPKSRFPMGTEASEEIRNAYFKESNKEKFRELFGFELVKIGFKYYVCPPGTYDLYKNNPTLQAYTVESLRALNYEGMSEEEKKKFDAENSF